MADRPAILLCVTGFDPAVWKEALERHAPDRRIVTDRSEVDATDITYAVVWKHVSGALNDLPCLKAVFSIGAGVDHVFADTQLPDVPIVRAVADDLTSRMSEYVVWQVLDHLRKGALYRQQQRDHVWHEDRHQPSARDVTVGIMGLGELGRDAAAKLIMLGFSVSGWSRTPKHVDGVETFSGDEGRGAFLAGADIIVCLLPLTPQTRGILSAPLFQSLKRRGPLGAPVLINAGRGGLQVDADILAALDGGTLSAASLDVFETEPLPETSPLWDHPRIFITPHAAATSMPDALIPPMIAQMDAHDRGAALRNTVDPTARY